MRDEHIVDVSGFEKTLGERWNTEDRIGHWYEASTAFASEHLGLGNGRTCLVIGSPIFEAIKLRKQGWDVTYMDVRKPDRKAGKSIVCDATAMTLEDESFDAVSTSCVLTHAGTGRYGDSVNIEHGDELMLGHIARVMRKDSRAAITFGPVASVEKMVRCGSAHRIYTVKETRRMLGATPLRIGDMKIWSFKTKRWITSGEEPTTDLANPDYISFMVEK